MRVVSGQSLATLFSGSRVWPKANNSGSGAVTAPWYRWGEVVQARLEALRLGPSGCVPWPLVPGRPYAEPPSPAALVEKPEFVAHTRLVHSWAEDTQELAFAEAWVQSTERF